MSSQRKTGQQKLTPGRRGRSGTLKGPLAQKHLDGLAVDLLGVCLDFLRSFGIDAADIPRLLALSKARTKAVTPAAKRTLRDALRLGGLVVEWSENPKFLDEGGHPRVLLTRGTGNTFATLSRRHFGSRSIRSVIDFGRHAHSFEIVAGDKVSLTGPSVLLTGNPQLVLAHAVEGTKRFLRTALRNRSRVAAVLRTDFLVG